MDDLIEQASPGAPWRPEPQLDGDGLRRKHDTIWLTNDDGDSLQLDEDDAADLVNAAIRAFDNRMADEQNANEAAAQANYERDTEDMEP